MWNRSQDSPLQPYFKKLFGIRRFIVFSVALLMIASCGDSEQPTKIGTTPPQITVVSDPAEGISEASKLVDSGPTTKSSEMSPGRNDAVTVGTTPREAAASISGQGLRESLLGDAISIGDFMLVVLGWDILEGSGFIQPDDGNHFVAVEIVLVNQSSSSTQVSGLLQASVKDAGNRRFTADLLGQSLVDNAPEGEIAPGERVRGQWVFSVPRDSKDLEFVFEPTIFASGKAVVGLGEAPQDLEAPHAIAGETTQQVFRFGDIVDIGKFIVVPLRWSTVIGDDFIQPDTGNQFISVELVMVNQTENSASISSLLQARLKDQEGRLYGIEFLAPPFMAPGLPSGNVSPGERIRGTLLFQVPEDSGNLQLVMDAEVFGEGKLFVEFGESSPDLMPPILLPSERSQGRVVSGERGISADFEVTVHGVLFPEQVVFQPPPDRRFVVADIEVRNAGSSAITVSSLLQFSLKDLDGWYFPTDIVATSAGVAGSVDGNLAPGERVRGPVGFAPYLESSDLVLVFEPDLFGESKIFLDLGIHGGIGGMPPELQPGKESVSRPGPGKAPPPNKEPPVTIQPTPGKPLVKGEILDAGFCTSLGVLFEPPAFGVEIGQPIADPTLAILPDGRFRMYVFAQGVGVVSAISSDGINFTEEDGFRLPEAGSGQPRILQLSDGRWRLYTTQTDAIVSFISDDGISFVPEPGTRITAAEAGLSSLSSPAFIEMEPGKYRMYYSTLAMPGQGPGGKQIGSATSNDLVTWTVEPGFRLGEGADVLTDSAEHPFPVKGPDGSTYLFYGKFTGPGTGEEGLYRAVSQDGVLFTEEAYTGLRMANDPDILTKPDGEQLIYYGSFSPEVGGMILAATCTEW